MCCAKLSLLRREYLPLAVNVLMNSLKTLHITKKYFLFQLPRKWSLNIVKLLAFIYQQCLGWFTMSLVEGSSETRLFTHFSNDVFRSLYLPKDISCEGYCFFKNLQNLI